MSRSLFITGASGYVGGRLLQLIEPGRYERIFCLTRRALAVPHSPVRRISGDLLEPAGYASALASCDTVIHLAAATGKKTAAEYFRANTEGTRVLVEACRRAGVGNLLYISTIAANFRLYSRFYHYAESKRQAEKIVAASGLRFAIVRPTIVIGKQAPVLESLSKLAAAPVIPIFGDGRATVQPVYVDDLVHGLLLIADECDFNGQTVEFGGPQVLSIEEFLVQIRRIRYGKQRRVIHIPLTPLIPVLGLLEKFLLPLLPVTAGQLASFANDGAAAERRSGMMGPEEVLRLVAAR